CWSVTTPARWQQPYASKPWIWRATTTFYLERRRSMTNKDVQATLTACLEELHLPTMRAEFQALALQAQQESLSYPSYLLELAERECQQRRHQRTERLLKASRLPLAKNLQTFDLKRLPTKVVQQVRTLLTGESSGHPASELPRQCVHSSEDS